MLHGRGEVWRPRQDGPRIGYFVHHRGALGGRAEDAYPHAVRRTQDRALWLPRDRRHRVWRWAHGEAYPEGRQQLPQVPREEELLPQGPWLRHEPRRAPTRRRQPSARRPSYHRVSALPSRSKGRPDRRAPYGYPPRWQEASEVSEGPSKDASPLLLPDH